MQLLNREPVTHGIQNRGFLNQVSSLHLNCENTAAGGGRQRSVLAVCGSVIALSS